MNWGAILIFTLLLCYALLWIYALVDCLRRKDLSAREKLAWGIAILATSFIGMFCYYAFTNRQRRVLGRHYDKALDPVTGRPYV